MFTEEYLGTTDKEKVLEQILDTLDWLNLQLVLESLEIAQTAFTLFLICLLREPAVLKMRVFSVTAALFKMTIINRYSFTTSNWISVYHNVINTLGERL